MEGKGRKKMKYDFTTILERKDQDALALDIIPYEGIEVEEGFDVIPMWVADMNYPTAPSILESVHSRLEKPHFGYYHASKPYYDAIAWWHKTRKQMDVAPGNIGYENGVLGGIACAFRAFTQPGEPVLVNSPTYIGFQSVFRDTGRKMVTSELYKDETGTWRMDYEDMEKKIIEQHIRTAIFCSPHNPTGRVWEKEEIEQAMELFKKHDVLVLSDEIWSDILYPGMVHHSTQSVSEDAKNRTIAFYAPSKTFSLAGLIGSYHVLYNEKFKDAMARASAATHYNSQNVLSMHALIGAYSPEGAEWTDELNEVLKTNIDIASDYFNTVEGVEFFKPEGTYMLYLDFSQWLKNHNMTLEELEKEGVKKGVIWQDGKQFLKDNTIRMNLAVPTSRVKEALERLDRYVFNK